MSNVIVSDLTQEELKRLLGYDPLTGVFTWKVRVSLRIHVGDVAGCRDRYGYHQICLHKRFYRAHRLAWLCVHGVWPGEMDHVNGVRDDNRIANLRIVTKSENQHNRRGARGYYWNKQYNKWQSYIALKGKQHNLGRFTNESDARDAYLEAKKTYHPTSPINQKWHLHQHGYSE